MKAAGCQTVAGSVDCDGGDYVAGSARGQSAGRVLSADPGVLTVTSGLGVSGGGLAVLSVRVGFDRWAASSGRAKPVRVACSVQRPQRSLSLLPVGCPMPVHKP